MRTYKVTIKDIPMVNDPKECLDYENEETEVHENITLENVMNFMSDFIKQYPEAKFQREYGFADIGLVYDGDGAYYHELDIEPEGS